LLDIREAIVNNSKKELGLKLKEDLKELSDQKDYKGILYLGYPIVSSDNNSDKIDAVLISKELGIYVFSLLENPTEESINMESSRQKRLKRILTQKLLNSDIFYDEETE